LLKNKRVKKTHTHNEYFLRYGNRPTTFGCIKSGDTLHIYLTDKGYYMFIDSTVKDIRYIVEDSFIVYTDNSSDTADRLIIHSRFKEGASLFFYDKDYNQYILNSNGKKDSLGRVYTEIVQAHQNVFIIKTKNGSGLYDKEGKNIFKTKYTISTLGNTLLVEFDEASKLMNILDLKGQYLAKNIIKIGRSDNDLQCVYYIESDSCYVFYNQEGKSRKICRKEPIVYFTGNFIVFKMSDSTLDVYNTQFNLLRPNLRVNIQETLNRSHINDQNYFAYRYNDTLYLMNALGKITPVVHKFQNIISVNDNYFLGLYYDSLNYTKYIVFNSAGKKLLEVNDSSYDARKLDLIERFSYYKTYWGKQLMIPVIYGKNSSDDQYKPFEGAEIIVIQHDTSYLIKLNDSLCWIEVEDYLSVGMIVTQFNIISECYDPTLTNYKPPVYYYIDKYGTVYYDE